MVGPIRFRAGIRIIRDLAELKPCVVRAKAKVDEACHGYAWLSRHEPKRRVSDRRTLIRNAQAEVAAGVSQLNIKKINRRNLMIALSSHVSSPVGRSGTR